VLVAVPSCRKDDWSQCPAWIGDHSSLLDRATPAERRQAVRDTWWNRLNGDHRFFFGHTNDVLLNDEISLPVSDSFRFHCDKNKAMLSWALQQGYEWVFRCDDDTFIKADQLEIPEKGDQVGWGPELGNWHNYITGGAGFWLSRAAVELIVNSPTTKTHEDDLWIGRDILEKSSLDRVHDPRYYPSPTHTIEIDKLPNDWITCHSCTPEIMRALFAKYQHQHVRNELQPA
jgi:hypothetical protein